jgi:tRNA pseudouridine38-40 synthase
VARYKLTIAYDGTDFHGWQRQEPPDPASDPALGDDRPRVVLRTVQEVLQTAVREIVREPVIVQGASRTDAGVHARGQVAVFDSGDAVRAADPGISDAGEGNAGVGEPGDAGEILGERRGVGWPAERGVDRLVRAVNSRLPDDVLVRSAAIVPPGFDPIKDATAKEYSYTFHVSARGERALFDRRYVQHVWHDMDVGAMNNGARRLVGVHDFAAFAAAGHGRLSTVRQVFACSVTEITACGDGANGLESGARRIVMRISGSGFLWNMVRIVAGTLVEVGRGRKTPEDVARAIESLDRRLAGPTMPARGLCLEWVRYGDTPTPDDAKDRAAT